jgi:hypothetical protein
MTEHGSLFRGSNQPAPLPGKLVADWPNEPHKNGSQSPVLRYVALYHCLNNVSLDLVTASLHLCGSLAYLLSRLSLYFHRKARYSEFMNHTEGVYHAANDRRCVCF